MRFSATLRCALTAIFAALAVICSADTPPTLHVGRFSAEGAGPAVPTGWKPLTFRNIDRHTRYSLVNDEGVTVVKAEAQASASGLIREIGVDLREYPIIQWRWKVANVLAKSDPSHKDGDDYPARIYVAFRYDAARVSLLDRVRYELIRLFYGVYPPHAGISYIWGSSLPMGTVLTNAYTDRVRMIVVRNGSEDLNRWRTEERNVYDDYKRAFGEEPPPVSGVAIMTDTDDTGESATGWYGDINFRKPAS